MRTRPSRSWRRSRAISASRSCTCRQDRFLSRLAGVSDPEEKRKIVGEEFIRVFEEEARKLGNVLLVQGTLYSDVIESGAPRGSRAIKSHHNVGGLPADMRMEPASRCGCCSRTRCAAWARSWLPERMVWRQPFRGSGSRSGSSARSPRSFAILRRADAILLEEVRRADLYRDLWQTFAVLPAIRSVGVQGDERT